MRNEMGHSAVSPTEACILGYEIFIHFYFGIWDIGPIYFGIWDIQEIWDMGYCNYTPPLKKVRGIMLYPPK